jgi:YidC/Oxa1 family membrane protein insertase
MDRNLVLAFALSFLVLSLWTLWTESTKPPESTPREVAAAEDGAPAQPGASPKAAAPSTPSADPNRFPQLPDAAPAAPPAPAGPGATPVDAGEISTPAATVELDRPLFDARLTARGAAIESWQLGEYTDAKGARILMVPEPSRVGPLAATPFIELGQGDLSQAVWQIEASSADSVTFAREQDGIALRKAYRFDSDGYAMRLRIDVVNGSTRSISPRFLVDWPVEARPERDFAEQFVAALHDGSVEKQPVSGLGSPGFFGSLFGRGPTTDYPVMASGIDWVGFETTYFLAAIFPDDPSQARARFVVIEPSQRGAAQVFFDPVELPPGQTLTREFLTYLGPKESERLDALGNGAAASIDLGWSWVHPLTKLFAWLLQALYSVIPNYGVAIILLTVLVRVVTAPLTVKQMRSMERLRRVQPKMKEIQERFKDDRQRQSEELMKLYRLEKVNPLGGCFPMLLQLPVFIGLFYALQSSIQLRHAPFFGWISDLSAPDELFTLPLIGIPVRVLPLVMGATMVVQQKISPTQMPDPAQARMMLIVMPIMMTVLFYQFPSGLVLYWMLSNVLAIAHQLWIGRNMAPVGRADQAAQA